MSDPSEPDFRTELRRAANAPVSPAFIANVLRRSHGRRRLRLISAFAAPALSAAVLIPLAVNMTQHHRPIPDHLGMAAGAVAAPETGVTASPEPRSTAPIACATGAVIDVVGSNGASDPVAAARGFVLPDYSTQGDVFLASPGRASAEQEVFAVRDGLQYVRFGVVQGTDGSWAVSSYQQLDTTC